MGQTGLEREEEAALPASPWDALELRGVWEQRGEARWFIAGLRRGWELGMRSIAAPGCCQREEEREGLLVPNPCWEAKSEEKAGKEWEAMQKGDGAHGEASWVLCDPLAAWQPS